MWGKILRVQKWILGLLGLTFFGVAGEFAIEYAREQGAYDNPTSTVVAVMNFLTPIVNNWWFALIMGASAGVYVSIWAAEKYRPKTATGATTPDHSEALSDNKIAWLTGEFRPVALGSRDLSVYYEGASPESTRFARDIANAILMAGTWQARASKTVFDTPETLTGLKICVQDPDQPPKDALILAQKLRSAQIDYD